jgi:putative spermidine/putrescine transport system substrate-binding protein
MRRAVIAAVLTASVLGVSAGPGVGAEGDGEPVTLTVVSWGGAYQEAMTNAWFDPYVEANPHVTLVQDEPTDYAKLQAMVEAGNVTWDVVDIENDFGLERTEHLLEPIDCTKVPCGELQPERYQTTGYRVPVILWGLVMAYRTDAWDGRAPQGWEDFFDLEEFPGKRTVRRSGPGSGILEGALLADGVDPAQLYPIDVERALDKLATIEDEIIWWEVGQQCAQLLADNEAVMGVCYNGRVFDIQQEGHPVEIQWNGALIQADYLVVPKGSPNVEAAMDFVAYMTSAEHNGRIADYISYAPANENAAGNVNPDMERHLPSTYADVTVARDDTWLDENFDAVAERFLEWLQR